MRIRTFIYQNKKFKITLTSTQQNNINSLKYEEIWKATNHEWLVLTIHQAGFLKFLKSRGLFEPHKKNFYKSILLLSNYLKVGTTHFMTSTETLKANTCSYLWYEHYLGWCDHSTTTFFVSLLNFSFVQSQLIFFTGNLNLYYMYYYMCLMASATFKKCCRP